MLQKALLGFPKKETKSLNLLALREFNSLTPLSQNTSAQNSYKRDEVPKSSGSQRI